MKELVNLALAKLLKKRGYNIPTHYYYLDKDLSFIKKGLKKYKSDNVLNYNGYYDFIYSAPELEEGILWLANNEREQYNTDLDNMKIDEYSCNHQKDGLCDDCEFMNFRMVGHPGGSSFHSTEQYYCEKGYWKEDF